MAYDSMLLYLGQTMNFILSLVFVGLLLACTALAQEDKTPIIDAAKLYETYCAACHGINMEGAQHTPLRKDNWAYGRDRLRMYRSVMFGIPNTDMIPWSQLLTEEQGYALVDYIIESQDSPPNAERELPTQLKTRDYLIKVETVVVEGFNSSPWSLEFIDERRALVTERRGGLRWIVDGKLDPQPIEGVPATTQYGDSGFYDLEIHPDYKSNGWIYFSHVHPLGDGSTRDTPAMTRVIRGRVEGHHWVDQEVIFQLDDARHFVQGTRWGSRMLFDMHGYLYFSIGDIGRNDDVQQLQFPAGKSYRIFPDGSIPPDNPFVGVEGGIEEIFTIGNRNIQGLAQHPVTGVIWATEHGPLGGDELNILQKGNNYGWPVITHGLQYTGDRVSPLTHKEGMEQPVKFWTPSPALSAIEFYTGHLFPKWKNNAFVATLAFEEIKRLNLGKTRVMSEEVIMKNHGRLRDIKTGPEGGIWVVLNNPHSVIRLVPQDI